MKPLILSFLQSYWVTLFFSMKKKKSASRSMGLIIQCISIKRIRRESILSLSIITEPLLFYKKYS